MQKALLILTVGLTLAGFLSCQKELEFSDSVVPSNFTAKINGAAWDANAVKNIIRTSGLITITGLSIDQRRIVMTVADSAVHNYRFAALSSANFALYSDSASVSLPFATSAWPAGMHGNLNITNIDTANKTMSGNFVFDALRITDGTSVSVTEGVFVNVPYITLINTPVPADTFRANLNGVNFSYTTLNVLLPPATGLLSITGSNNGALATPSLGLVLPDTIGTGIRPLGGIGASYVGSYNQNSTTFYGADSGNVVVLSRDLVNRRIRGTFGFRAKTVLPPQTFAWITDGYFSVRY